MIEIFNNDCFDVFPEIEDNSIDLFLLDLPYANKKFGNCTSCDWDTPIDLDKMWVEIKRIMKPNAIIVFFCNTKFGYSLIHSNPKWFRYDLIWEKSKKVGFLSANKMPLRKHENIYIFDNKEDDIDIVRNIELREYSKKCFHFIEKTKKELMKEIGQGIDHFFRFNSSQFGLPTEKTYNELIEKYKINEMDGYLTYDELKEKEETSIYNPQKTNGKPYKTKGKGECEIYKTKRTDNQNKGDRFPTSILPEFEKTILKFNNPHKTIHRTQKPVDLCEWLIKTYSNENDLVMDFTMGSGSCGVACQNTNRKFIGIERDPDIFKLAEDRLKKNAQE